MCVDYFGYIDCRKSPNSFPDNLDNKIACYHESDIAIINLALTANLSNQEPLDVHQCHMSNGHMVQNSEPST